MLAKLHMGPIPILFCTKCVTQQRNREKRYFVSHKRSFEELHFAWSCVTELCRSVASIFITWLCCLYDVMLLVWPCNRIKHINSKLLEALSEFLLRWLPKFKSLFTLNPVWVQESVCVDCELSAAETFSKETFLWNENKHTKLKVKFDQPVSKRLKNVSRY